MRQPSSSVSKPESWQMDTFPDDISLGATVLVATAGDPARYAVDLHALCEYGSDDDTALIVTTDAERTLETYGRHCDAATRPNLRFVDISGSEPAVPTLYGDATTIFTPSPGDLERLVLALSDLTEGRPPKDGARHLAIRSLTPILEAAPADRVCTVLDRITGLRGESGISLLGIDYTAHSEETFNTITQQVDGVLWVTNPSSDELDFEFRAAQSRYRSRSSNPPESSF